MDIETSGETVLVIDAGVPLVHESFSNSFTVILYESSSTQVPEHVHNFLPAHSSSGNHLECWQKYRSAVSREYSMRNCVADADAKAVYYNRTAGTITALHPPVTSGHAGHTVRSSIQNLYSTIPEGRTLVYSCKAHKPCGGNGDRVNGMIQVFLLSLLLNRRFLIDSDSPVELSAVLEPRHPDVLDWRPRRCLERGLSLDYIDRRKEFVDGLDLLVTSLRGDAGPASVYVTTNQLLMQSVLAHPSFPLASLREMPFLFSHLFEFLFKPTALLQEASNSLLPNRSPFVAIHFRAGDQAGWTDPARHSLERDLMKFIDCARKVGRRETWLLSADVPASVVRDKLRGVPELNSGQLQILDTRLAHIDRSGHAELEGGGFLAAWASWLTLGRGVGIVISRSFFSETAARISRFPAPHVRFFQGCVAVDFS